MSLIENQIISALTKRFSISTSIDEDGDDVTLVVNSHLGDKIIFTHETDLTPMIDLIVKRINRDV